MVKNIELDGQRCIEHEREAGMEEVKFHIK